MKRPRHDEKLYPHSPDVLEREKSEDGFSAGWGLHHQPAELYWLNMHTHMRPTTRPAIARAFDEYFERAASLRVRRQVLVDGKPDRIAHLAAKSAKDDRFLWMVWPAPEKPDLKFLKKWSTAPGFVGMKLHNHTVIMQAMDPGLWLSKAWDEMFEFCGEAGKPILWHVTQRMTDAPYMGGGRESYWKVGRPKGTKFGNRELLDVFEEVVSQHPRTQFIGAHHLHIGPESCAKLFHRHHNLSVDLSCGNIVRLGDEMYPADQKRWRDYVIKFADRLHFGTDCILGSTASNWVLWESLAAHIRFVRQLRLPVDVLNKVAHANFERLAGLDVVPLDSRQWLGVRP